MPQISERIQKKLWIRLHYISSTASPTELNATLAKELEEDTRFTFPSKTGQLRKKDDEEIKVAL